jgi:hypothetical protein
MGLTTVTILTVPMASILLCAVYRALETLNGTQQNNGTLLYRAAGEESVV